MSHGRSGFWCIGLALLWLGCNEPPLYQTRAREFLAEREEPARLIEALVEQRELEAEDAERLARYDDRAVLHLLATNPSTPQSIVLRLAEHSHVEVLTGVVMNPALELDVLLRLRTPGEYTTVNSALARNEVLPPDLLREMHANGEANLLSFALNPNCPTDLMREIAQEGNETARIWLAAHPKLPADVARTLEADASPLVLDALARNPAVRAEQSPVQSPVQSPDQRPERQD